MRESQAELSPGDILHFIAGQIDEIEEGLRRIESAIILAAEAGASDRRIIQNLDRSLQVLSDLSRLCTGASQDLEDRTAKAEHVSRHLRLAHLKAHLTGPDMAPAQHESEPDFFD